MARAELDIVNGFYQSYRKHHDSNSLTLMVISIVLLIIAAWICIEAVLAFRRKLPDTEGKKP